MYKIKINYRIICTLCNKARFSNLQGYVNHSRLKHAIEFPTHEEAVWCSGVPIDEKQIPKDHPIKRTIFKPTLINNNDHKVEKLI